MLKNNTRPDWEERKQELLEYIRAHSGKFNGSEISYTLNHSLKDLKVVDNHYLGYYEALTKEGRIRYDMRLAKWYAVGAEYNSKKKTEKGQSVKITDYL